MGRPKGWTTTVTGRPAQRFPGHPGLRREHRQAFWAALARCHRTAPVASRSPTATGALGTMDHVARPGERRQRSTR